MYDPFILDRIHFDQEQRERRVTVPRNHRRTARTAARLSAFAPRRRATAPAEC